MKTNAPTLIPTIVSVERPVSLEVEGDDGDGDDEDGDGEEGDDGGRVQFLVSVNGGQGTPFGEAILITVLFLVWVFETQLLHGDQSDTLQLVQGR